MPEVPAVAALSFLWGLAVAFGCMLLIPDEVNGWLTFAIGLTAWVTMTNPYMEWVMRRARRFAGAETPGRGD